MYFRFGIALCVVIAVSVCGVMIERDNRLLQEQVTQQQSRHAELTAQIAAARTESARLGAPPQLLQAVEDGRIALPALESASQVVRTEQHDVH